MQRAVAQLLIISWQSFSVLPQFPVHYTVVLIIKKRGKASLSLYLSDLLWFKSGDALVKQQRKKIERATCLAKSM